MVKSETFMKVTNQDIYNEIKDIKKTLTDSLGKLKEENSKDHEAIKSKQDKTNGSVKLTKWIATTALAIALISIGYLFTHLLK